MSSGIDDNDHNLSQLDIKKYVLIIFRSFLLFFLLPVASIYIELVLVEQYFRFICN